MSAGRRHGPRPRVDLVRHQPPLQQREQRRLADVVHERDVVVVELVRGRIGVGGAFRDGRDVVVSEVGGLLPDLYQPYEA